MSLLSEFKEFAMKGNVVDMAVGIVIGAAFGKIVSAFVDAIVMPALGWVIGGVDFSSLARHARRQRGDRRAGHHRLRPVHPGAGRLPDHRRRDLHGAQGDQPAEEAGAGRGRRRRPPAEYVLLTEIRDLLRQR